MNNNIQSPLGAKRDIKDRRDLRVGGITKPAYIPQQVFELPETLKPKNQFSRGSCTSQAQSHHKERQENNRCSARFIMALTKQLESNTEYGAYTRDTFKVVKEFGACSELIMPEPPASMSWNDYIDFTRIPQEAYKDAEKHKSNSYWRVENKIEDIRRTLITHKNSIVISMDWRVGFNKPDGNGRLPVDNFGESAGGHAIEIRGFDDIKKDILCKNSWGESWGKNGYFSIPYTLFGKIVWDMWCSLDIPEDLPVDNYYGQKRTWATYLIEKSFAFNSWLFKKIGRLPNNREIKGLAYGKWSYDSIFVGKVGDIWLYMTKPEAIKQGKIDKDENIL